MDNVLQTIQDALDKKGMSAAAASKAAADNPSLIKNMLNARGDNPRYNYQALEKLARVLDLELYFGPRRSTEPTTVTEVDGSQFAAIARYDASAAAGGGIINFEEPPADHLAFSQAWLEGQGIRSSEALLLTVSGDSMAPTVNDGDLVMIDRGKNEVRTGKAYVFNDPEDGTRLKRLEVLEGAGIIIRSDSRDQDKYPPEFRKGPAADAVLQGVIGEVVWSAHKW
jgi:phage repressor protein C with HTH and peptisase S24 domain